jgi:glutamate 5-kinase
MRDVNNENSLIRRVRPSEQEKFSQFVTAGKSANGTGGMELKYGHACDLANVGIETHIANGKLPHVLERLLLQKESIGTVFKAA